MYRVKVKLIHKTKRGCNNRSIVHRKLHIVPKGSEKKKSTKSSMSVIADALSIASSIISIVLAILEYLA